MCARGKVIAILTLCLGLVALALAGICFRDELLSQWYQYRLGSGDAPGSWDLSRSLEDRGPRLQEVAEDWYIARLESGRAESMVQAAERLGEMGSVRAIPHLLVSADSRMKAKEDIPRDLHARISSVTP